MLRILQSHTVAWMSLSFTIPSLIGCNPPDALKLRLTPARESFGEGVPVRLTATFSTSEGVVCIERPTINAFDVELRRLDFGERLEQTQFAYCGMQGLLILPFYPLLHAGCYLDVADASGRFVVLTSNKKHIVPITILGTDQGFEMSSDADPLYSRRKPNGSLPPGRYRLIVKFQSEPSWVYPPPLFWSLYDQPVEAATEFYVEQAAK